MEHPRALTSARRVILRRMSGHETSPAQPSPQLWGVCGGSGSGKSTLVEVLMELAPPGAVTVVHFDAYYRDLSHLSEEKRAAVNFDHPDSLESELLIEHVNELLAGRDTSMPIYDFARHARLPRVELLKAAPVILVEGILLYAFRELVKLFDYRVFIDVPEPVRLERRTARDVVTRGRSAESVRAQFEKTVSPMHWEFVQPAIHMADRVVSYGEDFNEVALEFAGRLAPHWAGSPPIGTSRSPLGP